MELPVIQPGRPAAGAPPIFEKIGIVGLGLIGGSIAMAARAIWPTSLVIAVDNKDVLETAMRLHAIDVAADDMIVLAEADLVILAAPVRQNLQLLNELDANVRVPTVVTDTGSTKRAIVEAARQREAFARIPEAEGPEQQLAQRQQHEQREQPDEHGLQRAAGTAAAPCASGRP